VWLATDTSIVEEILELKQNIEFIFIFDIEGGKQETRDSQNYRLPILLSLTLK
jgi:hypothetical protein